MMHESQQNTDILAQGSHEAAREGSVPLCEDDTWNPKETEFFAQGFMRQPTKERPVSKVLGAILELTKWLLHLLQIRLSDRLL